MCAREERGTPFIPIHHSSRAVRGATNFIIKFLKGIDYTEREGPGTFVWQMRGEL